jgi:hypothetical protein
MNHAPRSARRPTPGLNQRSKTNNAHRARFHLYYRVAYFAAQHAQEIQRAVCILSRCNAKSVYSISFATMHRAPFVYKFPL